MVGELVVNRPSRSEVQLSVFETSPSSESMAVATKSTPGWLMEPPSPSGVVPSMNTSTLTSLSLAAIFLFTFPSATAELSIESVVDGGPAAAAGLAEGDVLRRLADHPVQNLDDLDQALDGRQTGDQVRIDIERSGDERSVQLTLGIDASLGVKLKADPSGEPTRGTVVCQEWIEQHYQMDRLLPELELNDAMAGQPDELRACVRNDTQRMRSDSAIQYCENVFKVHCGALDLLTEIGEALADRCGEQLATSRGTDYLQSPAWRTCGRERVFDLYALGERIVNVDSCAQVVDAECA